MADLDTRYNPKLEEPKIREFWEQQGVFKFNPKSGKPLYPIDTPPPTVSGKMHIGHAFSYSQQDFIARYKRMRGFEVFYPFGTDDNGLATERLIERLKNVRSKHMTRKDFVSLCLRTLDDLRPAFVQDWKNLAISCDYSIFYSTIHPRCQKLSQQSFISLYNDGREYRRKAPIIFCPVCKTAIAQVEMEDSERTSTLNYIKAKVEGLPEGNAYAIYATTRPELHPGCVGISLDKEGTYALVELNRLDPETQQAERWILSKEGVEKFKSEFKKDIPDMNLRIVKEWKGRELIGKKVQIPFAQHPVPFSHDESAKTEYGSGLVYYCTYGGLDCVEWMTRHPEVQAIPIMDESGTYTLGPYKGMNSGDARKKVLEDLEKMGLLIKKEHLKHVVNVHERCATDIEYIATTQWFIRILDLREDIIQWGKELHWYPQFMFHRYENWAKGLKWDWCISRQRHFGVPIPVWYCKNCGEVKVAEEAQLPVDPVEDKPRGACEKCKGKEFEPERDVLDTWATSSLTPKLAISLFPQLEDQLFPMALRPQGHDIITFWLFNTVIKSRLHTQKNPWKDVVISGFALDPHGKKMSKSKGNVVEPQVMIDKYSGDALRFWAAGSKLGDDLPFQEKDLVTGIKMSTKLWNASRFAITMLKDYHLEKPSFLANHHLTATDTGGMLLIDRWLLCKLHKLIKECTESFDKYEYVKTKAEVEKFFWHTLCDNYIEIVKTRLYNAEKYGVAVTTSGRYALYQAISTVLKMLAPIMPYITESVYQLYFAKMEKKQSIHHESWPSCDDRLIDETVEQTGDLFVDVLSTVRKYKSENDKALNWPVAELVIECSDADKKTLSAMLDDLKNATTSSQITFGVGNIACSEHSVRVKIVLGEKKEKND